MLNRLLSFIGACSLILATTAMVPMLPAYATGTECAGKSCDGSCNMGSCEDTSGCGCSETSIASPSDCSRG